MAQAAMKPAGQGRLWVISEVYYPQETATGFYMTGLAEGLARHFSVHVICAHPPCPRGNSPVPSRETHRGVQIERCRGTTLNKDVVALRLLNLLTISAAILTRAVHNLRRWDVVLVVTNPPLLPFVVAAACRLRGARCVLRIDDVYPEVMVATGLTRPEALLARLLTVVTRRLYRSVDRIVVLGRDMKALVERKLGAPDSWVIVIPKWADVAEVHPIPKADSALARELNLVGKFVVQCAGNMGRAQGIEAVFAAAEMLKDNIDIHFLFVGTGAKRAWMEHQVQERALGNVTLVGQRPRADQSGFLNACDIAVVPLVPGMSGVGVPSRMYNVMAAGRPILAVADPDSELALVVQEERIGWLAHPAQPAALVKAILNARSHPELLREMGARARRAAEQRYTAERVLGFYREAIQGLLRP
jgi:colanic acid biosynthesis glycosyl transferase WcaI